MIAVALLSIGSALLAILITWQVKTVLPETAAVVKYNLYILAPVFIANVTLGLGFIKAHEVLKSMPLVMAIQTAIYYCFLILFSYLILGERPEFVRLLGGLALICAGIFVLKG